MLGIFLFNSKFISTVNDEIKENFNDQTESNISFWISRLQIFYIDGTIFIYVITFH